MFAVWEGQRIMPNVKEIGNVKKFVIRYNAPLLALEFWVNGEMLPHYVTKRLISKMGAERYQEIRVI